MAVFSSPSLTGNELGYKGTNGPIFHQTAQGFEVGFMTNRIKEWIDQSKKRPGVVSEIHIDELSRRFLSDRHWVSGTIELMEKAGIELRKGRRREILVAAFALVTLDVLQGP